MASSPGNQHYVRKDGTCTHCLRREIRRGGLAGVFCAICERSGHTARFCPQTAIGRVRLEGGRMPSKAVSP